MDFDCEVINSKGIKYHYVDNGKNIILYTNKEDMELKIQQKDKFLGTIMKDVKDSRALKDIDSIKKIANLIIPPL